MRTAITGTALVTVYAVLGALQSLVFDPLAAVPDSNLGQIRAAVDGAGQSMSVPLVLTLMTIPVLLAVAVLVLTVRRPQLTTVAVAALYLGLLVVGAPLFLFASFGPSIAVADTFGVSGGAHTPVPAVLYVTSLLALIGGAICLAQLAAPGRVVESRKIVT